MFAIKEQRIAVIGGDARYIELIRKLNELPGISTIIVGFNKLEQSFTGSKQVSFDELDLQYIDAIILPITGVSTNGEVETVFSNEKIYLTKTWFSKFPTDLPIFTGMANDHLKEITKNTNAILYPLLDRDDVAIFNSIPTAEGAIMMAMKHTDYTIHSSRIIVAGFGRVGHTVANKFSALGAKVSVAAKSIRDLARITEMGLSAISLERLSDYTTNCDILINTIPACVITKESIQHLPHHALIFDLASTPGGTDFEYAKQRGIKAILSESLPGLVAPKTAGKILADVITQILMERKELKNEFKR